MLTQGEAGPLHPQNNAANNNNNNNNDNADDDDDKPLVPRNTANGKATVAALMNAKQNDNNKKKTEDVGRSWINNCISPDSKCIFCADFKAPYFDGKNPQKYSSGEFRGRYHYHIANFFNYHYKTTHKDITCLADVMNNADHKAKYEANVKAHATTKNTTTIAEEAVLNFFAKKGCPDLWIGDPDFTDMINAIVANKGLPFTSRATLVDKRHDLAERELETNYAFCAGNDVTLHLDVVTRHSNRFVGITATVWNPDRAKNTEFPHGASSVRIKHPRDNVNKLIEFDHPHHRAQRTILLDLRCDKQHPYTKGVDGSKAYVLTPNEASATAAEQEQRIENPRIQLQPQRDDDEDERFTGDVGHEDGDDDEKRAEANQNNNGCISADALAEHLQEVIKSLWAVGARVIGMCTDNGTNLSALAAALRQLDVPIYINDVRCFAHLIQRVCNQWFGHNRTEADVRCLNNVMLAFIEIRKWLNNEHNESVPEPVITRWNTFYNLVRYVYDKYLDESQNHALREKTLEQLNVLWPTDKRIGINRVLQSTRTFLDRLKPIYDFTQIVQSNGAHLGLGIAALSDVHSSILPAYLPAFTNRLTSVYGRFLTDPVVIFLALLPWSTHDNNEANKTLRRNFLEKVELCLHRCGAFPIISRTTKISDAQRADRHTEYRTFVIEAFKKWRETVNADVLPVPPKQERTLHNFNQMWLEFTNTQNHLGILAHFVLTLSATACSEAACERAFSSLKRIIDNLRSRCTTKHVFEQLLVAERDKSKAPRENSFYAEPPKEDKNNQQQAAGHPSDVVKKTQITNSFVNLCMKQWLDAVNKNKIKLPDPTANQEVLNVAEDDAANEEGANENNDDGQMMMMIQQTCSICQLPKQNTSRCVGAKSKAARTTRCPASRHVCEDCQGGDGHAHCGMCRIK